VISLRSKILIVGASFAPLSLAAIWFYEFRALREIQSQQMSPYQAVQFQLRTNPVWLPKLLLLVIFGALCTIPLIISLFLDNRRKSTLH
jgi:hypothetical protein